MKLLLDASELLAESASPAPDTVTNPDHELLIITAVCSTLISVTGLIMAAMLCSWCFGRKKYDSDEEESLNEYKTVAYGGDETSSMRDSSIAGVTPNHSPSHNGSAQSRTSSTQHLTSVGNKKSSRFDRHKTVTEHVQPLNNTNQVAHMVTEDTVAFSQQKRKPSKEMETKARSQKNQRSPFIPIDTQTRSLQNQQQPSIPFITPDINSQDDCPNRDQRKVSWPIISHKQPNQNPRRPSIPVEMITLATQHNQDNCPESNQRKGSIYSIQSFTEKAYNLFGLTESKNTRVPSVIEEEVPEVPCTSTLIPQTKDCQDKSKTTTGERANNMKSEDEHAPSSTTYRSLWHRVKLKLPLILSIRRPKENEKRPSIPIEMENLDMQDINNQNDSPKPKRKGSLAAFQEKACYLFGLNEGKKKSEQCVIEEVPCTSSQLPQTKGVQKNSQQGGANNTKLKNKHASTKRSLWYRVKLKLPLILSLRRPKERPKEYSPKRRASMFASREEFIRRFSMNDHQLERRSSPNRDDPKSKNILRRFSLGNQPMAKVEPPEPPPQVSNVQQLISMFKDKIQEETNLPARHLSRESRHKVKRLKRKYAEQEKIKRYANSRFYHSSSQSAKESAPPRSGAGNVAADKDEQTSAQDLHTQRVINNLRRGSHVMTEDEKQNAYVNLIKRRREVQRMRKQYMQRTGHSVEVDSYECDPPIPADVSL